MALLYSGKDVRIEDGPIVSVCVRKGWWNKTEEWKQVDVRDIEMDASLPFYFHSPWGRHWIDDLSVNIRNISHLIGRCRVDREGAVLIREHPDTVSGRFWCINAPMREIAGAAPSAYVCPFGAVEFVGLAPEPYFYTPGRGPYSAKNIRDFPWPPEKIAEVIGVPLKP